MNSCWKCPVWLLKVLVPDLTFFLALDLSALQHLRHLVPSTPPLPHSPPFSHLPITRPTTQSLAPSLLRPSSTVKHLPAESGPPLGQQGEAG